MSDWLPILRRRGVSVLFQSYINQGYKDAYYEELLGVPHGLGSHRYVDGWVIVHTGDADAFTSMFIPRLDEPAYVRYFLRQCTRVANELLAFGDDIRAQTYATSDHATLLLDFMRFSSYSIHVMPFLNTMVFVQDAVEQRVRRALSEHYQLDTESSDLAERMQDHMSADTRMPLASQAMAELSRLEREVRLSFPAIAAKLQADPTSVSPQDLKAASAELAEAFDRYLDAYDFLGTNYYVGAPTSHTELCEQLAGFMLRGIDSGDDTGAYVRSADASDLPVSTRELLSSARELQYLREYRLEALYKSGRDCRILLTRIGEELGLSYPELLCMTFHEIQRALTADTPDIDLETINKRTEGYASCVEDGEPAILVAPDIEALLHGLPDAAEPAESLSGVTAYAGECSGPIRIVSDLSQAEHVQAGDIMAAPMTMPYHVPAMARSAAVLTDEGGILSHAAIVARELRVPCIVGLKTITSAFEDGTEIRVRATPSGGFVDRIRTP